MEHVSNGRFLQKAMKRSVFQHRPTEKFFPCPDSIKTSGHTKRFLTSVSVGLSLSFSGPVVYVLDLADRLISKAGPFAAAGIMVGSIYWTAVTYGAVTVMQVSQVFFFFFNNFLN